MQPYIIGIAGGSGSGKSTFIDRIEERFGEQIAVLRYDNYYREQAGVAFEQRTAMNYDHPDSLETDLLVKHLEDLKRGHAIQSPVYDFSQHNRLDKTIEVQPRPTILVEGILLLVDKRLRDLCDLTIFIEVDADERILRRIRRDVLERGRHLEGIIDQYLATVKPMHNRYVEPTKALADIVTNGDPSDAVFDLISLKIEGMLSHAAEK